MPILRRARAKTADADDVRSDLPQGTLDLLILKVLAPEPLHGYAIAQRLQQISRDVVQVQQGSLYPALHRLENRGLLAAESKLSDTGREAKFYCRGGARGRVADKALPSTRDTPLMLPIVALMRSILMEPR